MTKLKFRKSYLNHKIIIIFYQYALNKIATLYGNYVKFPSIYSTAYNKKKSQKFNLNL